MVPVQKRRILPGWLGLLLIAVLLSACASSPEVERQNREIQAIQQEIEVGQAALAKIAGAYGVLHDREATEYLTYYLQSLTMYVERQGLAYRCIILATDQVNAYALPGGYIAITLGALKKISQPGELAGILAHELGHVNRRHILDHVKIQVQPDLLETLGKIIAGPRLVITGSINQISDAISERLFLEGFAAEQEYEADSYAVDLLQSLGLDSQPYVDFLAALYASPEKAELENLDKTHPPLEIRLERLRAQVLPGQRTLQPSAEFEAFLQSISNLRTEP